MLINNHQTIFHITHWKAGSQWIYKILQALCQNQIVPPVLGETQFLQEAIIQGGVYPTVYVTREQFYSVNIPENHYKFVVIRDLRDTLISGYFSIRYSHKPIDNRLIEWQNYLKQSSVEDGLLMLIDEWLPFSAEIQKSWVTHDELIIRYEDLLSNDIELFFSILINQAKLEISPEHLTRVIISNRFEMLSGGRKPGEENYLAHERKGISGDWKNHFTPIVSSRFDNIYGQLLSDAGYQ